MLRPFVFVSRERHADVVESVDTRDLDETLSALAETPAVELLKVGETCQMAIPSQASKEEGVETRRAAPKAKARVKV